LPFSRGVGSGAPLHQRDPRMADSICTAWLVIFVKKVRLHPFERGLLTDIEIDQHHGLGVACTCGERGVIPTASLDRPRIMRKASIGKQHGLSIARAIFPIMAK